ncbi:MAG: LysM peptidoglycan-binding domain-containing protein [Acidimicrobiales bacterium]|nr:LysM peptidoglycan-binding domain-containing protein [Acidimicrobiales bacterium]
MVALLTSDPIYRSSAPELRSPGQIPVRHLHSVPAVHGGARSSHARSTDRSAASDPAISYRSLVILVGAAIVVALILLAGFRAIQGQPPSGSWADVQQAARFQAPVAHQNDVLWTVQPGETLWGIAQSVAPAADRREVVQILTEANGGSSIWAGQQIVIPAGLAERGAQGESAASNN